MFCPICGSRIRNENGVCACGFIDPTIKKSNPVQPKPEMKEQTVIDTIPSKAEDTAPIAPPMAPPSYTPPVQQYFTQPAAPMATPAYKSMKWHSVYQAIIFFDLVVNLIYLMRYDFFGSVSLLLSAFFENIGALYNVMVGVTSLIVVVLCVSVAISLIKRKYGMWEKLRNYYKFYISKSIFLYILSLLLGSSGWRYDSADISIFVMFVVATFAVKIYYKKRRPYFVN